MELGNFPDFITAAKILTEFYSLAKTHLVSVLLYNLGYIITGAAWK